MNGAAVMELVGAARTYPGPPAVQALHPTDLSIAAGDLLAIVGPSGSGKSTLLNLLGLLDRVTDGDLFLTGRSTAELSEAERCGLRAHALGFVFQSFHLLDDRSAVHNVELGLLYQRVPRKERRERSIEVLDALGLGERMWAAPSELSGGERQRVAIARAIVRRPSVLLCDEPTGNLDSANGQQILTLLRALNAEGMTVVIITHDPDVARQATRCVEIRDGHLRERAASDLTT